MVEFRDRLESSRQRGRRITLRIVHRSEQTSQRPTFSVGKRKHGISYKKKTRRMLIRRPSEWGSSIAGSHSEKITLSGGLVNGATPIGLSAGKPTVLNGPD